MQVAVIGAGLAGLSAASQLAGAGWEVVVFEKSRGAGGRTATRRGPQGTRFDHGAPFLRDEHGPLTGLAATERYDAVQESGDPLSALVGSPSANAPAKALAAGLELRTAVRIEAIGWDGPRLALGDETGGALGTWDAVIVTAPAPQAADLLRVAAPDLAARADAVAFDPCWSAMAAWDAPLELPWAAARGGALRWALAESAKPGRASGERWVLQATAEWSEAHLEEPADAVAALLLEEFAQIAGRPLPPAGHLAAHRWRYAEPRTPLTEPVLQHGRLLAAGDWCGGTTAGAAVRSGRAAALALTAGAR